MDAHSGCDRPLTPWGCREGWEHREGWEGIQGTGTDIGDHAAFEPIGSPMGRPWAEGVSDG